jgi:hypothetical protein
LHAAWIGSASPPHPEKPAATTPIIELRITIPRKTLIAISF